VTLLSLMFSHPFYRKKKEFTSHENLVVALRLEPSFFENHNMFFS
jgi:hypothetical protein